MRTRLKDRSVKQVNRSQRFSAATLGPLLMTVWAVSAAVATAFNLSPIRMLELQTQALFFNLRGPTPPPKDIVILAIDDDSLTRGRDSKELKELQPIKSWPWRRTAYAEVINKVMAAGARSISIDVIFDLTGERLADDKQLQQTLQRYVGRVTLSAIHASSQTNGGGLDQLIYPDPMFQTVPNSIGFINYPIEIDGRFRRFSNVYLQRIDAGLRRSQPNLISFDEASLNAANLTISPPKGDYIFFYGRQNTFPTVSFWHILYPKNWELLQKQQVFKDKIVLIGPTAAILQDFHSTPFGELPGVEIHANAIATLLENRAIADAMPNSVQRGILLFLAIIAVGIAVNKLSLRPIPRFFLSLGIALTWAVISYLSFAYGGLLLPVAVPLIAIALGGLTYLGTGALSDQLEKLRLRRTLERYVAAPIVQEILNQPEEFQALLQGRKLKAAVLFCDIRGFTTLSYKLPAEQLIAQLNAYLNAMVTAIGEARGTIDKFIGDAVMAEFGSPVSQGEKNDAMNAIQAALAMRRALAELRQQWQEEGKFLFYHGIGISYGEVIAGNIGSLQRLEYTVIGDTVNVASRVEGLTKTFRTDILITESLYNLVKDKVEVVFIGEQRLRGREETSTCLYSLIGLRGDSTDLYYQVQAELRHYLEGREVQDTQREQYHPDPRLAGP